MTYFLIFVRSNKIYGILRSIMKKSFVFYYVIVIALSTACSSSKSKVIVPYNGGTGTYTKLIWQDEFDKDGQPDSNKWGYEKGYVRNNELQYYTVNRPENATVKNGYLTITALKDSALIDGKIRPITSASLMTRGKGDWKYGRIEVRAKLPSALGTWPAIWMMPTKSGTSNWPKNGEIDIMEYVGYDPDKIHFNVHTQKYNHMVNNGRGSSIRLKSPDKDFHVYAIEWFPDRIDWYIDEQKAFSVSDNGEGWDAWPFQEAFYLIINFAFGGAWGAAKGVDQSSLPLEYHIDYVRVFQ